MTCIFRDQPIRIRMTPNGVVHAGAYRNLVGILDQNLIHQLDYTLVMNTYLNIRS